MRKAKLISHFGTQQNVADALGLTQRGVSKWPDPVPLGWACILEKMTGLRVELRLYKTLPPGFRMRRSAARRVNA